MPFENNRTHFPLEEIAELTRSIRSASNGATLQSQTSSNQRTPEPLDEPTQKLFKAIDNEDLGAFEHFEQALAEGADVNAFDKGYTPLMTIIINGDDSPICLKMMMLLLQHQSLNINAQETKEHNTALHLAFLMENRNFVQMLLRHPSINTNIKNKVFLLQDKYLGPGYDGIRAHLIEDAQRKQYFFYTSKEYIEKIGRIQKKDFSHLTMEITKAQEGKGLLDALFSGNIYQAKRLLNQELNPNCWKRTYNEEIETPLSLIIESCLQGIPPDNKEVLTKLLKHKELDFSQIKPIQAIERNSWVKQIIRQAITERLTATINKKDLDDVKKLVEDNCFMSHAVVTAALRNVNNPIESITNYLNEKFSANTNNIPKDFEEFVQELVDELERTKAQLIETERELDMIVRERTRGINKISQLEEDLRQEKSAQKTKINDLNSEVTRLNRIVYGRASDTVEISQLKRDLKQVREERDRLSSENRLLRTRGSSNKNEKSSRVISPGRKQSNYASAAFVLSGAFAVGACLTIPNLEICIPLAVTAFAFFTIGCYCSYKANTILSDVKSTQLDNVISLE